MTPFAVGLFFLGVLVVVILAEGRRQKKKYGASGRGASLSAVGMLDVQSHLQADRKVELLVQQQKGEETEIEQSQESGEP